MTLDEVSSKKDSLEMKFTHILTQFTPNNQTASLPLTSIVGKTKKQWNNMRVNYESLIM